MRSLLCVFAMLSSALYANAPEESYVSSTDASYDGNALVLSGHVLLDHGLGKMTAEEASLEKQIAGKDFPFSVIHLKKDVLLSLKSSAKLTCDFADLDFNTLKGYLTAPERGSVSYVDALQKKNGTALPLRLLSKSIELSLLKQEKEDKKTEYDVETVLAKEEVVIDYDQAFVLRAGQALYKKAAAQGREFSGTITAYPKDENSPCRLSHQGDVVDSIKIDLDLVHSTILLQKPTGMLISPLVPHLSKGEVHFTADRLIWDHARQLLLLEGNAEIEESHLGHITANEQIAIEQTTLQGKKVIKAIRTQGPTKLAYQDPASPQYHKLSCFGSLQIDREHMNAVLTSPAKDVISKAEQIYYEECKMGAYADKAFIEYAVEDNSFQPVSFTLKGNVCVFSHDKSQPFRCGLSDRLNYSPTTKTLILSASPGRRVLFWDQEQAMRISAQEVHLTEDPLTRETLIKGVGNVKFTLSAEENEMLLGFFPQYQSSP